MKKINMVKDIHKFLNNSLHFVVKPARYIGGEVNSIRKSTDQNIFRWALCYPDLYEIGMSNIALQLLYSIINSDENLSAERFFCPDVDLADLMRKESIPPFTLETFSPISDFDVIGFSIGYELTYTNILYLLDLAQIPFLSSDRNEDYPLIAAGGPCTFNPEPVSDIFDIIFIGEADTAIIRMSNSIAEMKKQGFSKIEILNKISKEIEGVYVPSVMNPALSRTDKNPFYVKRSIEPDLNAIKYLDKPVIPNAMSVQDRGAVEISRGCAWGCRFCQAGFIYRPVRERDVSTIISIVDSIHKNSGYREFSLASLSTADYSMLENLLLQLNQSFAKNGISFSLPSLRIDSFNIEFAKNIKEVRKSGLTYAIESADKDQQLLINKPHNNDQITELISKISNLGWKTVKLYFMLGLPYPDSISSEDFEENCVIDFVNNLLSRVKKIKFNVHLGVFVPKPHTPFQWTRQLHYEEGFKKIKHIIAAFRNNKRVKVKFQDPRMSLIEGLISRGSRETFNVILSAYKNGAFFDAWDDKFNFNTWLNALEENNYTTSRILNQKDVSESLPWDFISCGVKKEFLVKEYIRSKNMVLHESCWKECPEHCGTCKSGIKPKISGIDKPITEEEFILYKNYQNEFFQKIKSERPVKILRMRFTKDGLAKFISHRDIVNILDRALVRCDIPVVYSQGFNPIPQIEFTPPNPVGVSGLNEIVQIKVYNDDLPLNSIKSNLNSFLPDGVSINEIDIIPLNFSINKNIESFEYIIELDSLAETLIYGIDNKLDILRDKTNILNIKGKETPNSVIKIDYSKETKSLSALIKWMPSGGTSIIDLLHSLFELSKQEIIALGICRKNVNLKD